MSSVHKIAFFAPLFVASCAAPRVAQDYQRDTLITEVRQEVVYKDSIIFVPIPAEAERAVLADSDTSHLETMVAESQAFVADGRLHHTLRNKELLLPVETKLPKYIYEKKNNIIRERRIVETIEKEKQLSRWQRFVMALGYGVLVALAIWLAVRLYRFQS